MLDTSPDRGARRTDADFSAHPVRSVVRCRQGNGAAWSAARTTGWKRSASPFPKPARPCGRAGAAAREFLVERHGAAERHAELVADSRERPAFLRAAGLT